MAPTTVTPGMQRDDTPSRRGTPVADAPPSPESGATPGFTPAQVEAAVSVIASFVANFEPFRYSTEDAASLVASFNRAERVCQAGKTLAAARVAESSRHLGTGHRNCAEWLAEVTGESRGEATDLLHLGESLSAQPEVDEAYREGRLSRTRAALVAAAARVNPRGEHELVAGAATDTLRQLRERCARVRAEGRTAEEQARAYEAIRASRRCRTWTDASGAFRLEALLTPDAGAFVSAALTPEADRLFGLARTAGRHESPDAYAADALFALVTGRGVDDPRVGRDAHPGASMPQEERTPPAPPPRPAATVHLRVDLAALRRGKTASGEVCEIPGVGPVPLGVARDLLGDALLDLVITDGVDVTTVCHLGRSIPAALRTALMERDRCCVVPGCDTRHGLEIDHWRVPFAEGGAASLYNLARLCGHHHYLRTHKGFQLDGGPGQWRWRAPLATPLTPAPGAQLPAPVNPTTGSPGSDPPLFIQRE
jgi:hypothetical protein